MATNNDNLSKLYEMGKSFHPDTSATWPVTAPNGSTTSGTTNTYTPQQLYEKNKKFHQDTSNIWTTTSSNGSVISPSSSTVTGTSTTTDGVSPNFNPALNRKAEKLKLMAKGMSRRDAKNQATLLTVREIEALGDKATPELQAWANARRKLYTYDSKSGTLTRNKSNFWNIFGTIMGGLTLGPTGAIIANSTIPMYKNTKDNTNWGSTPADKAKVTQNGQYTFNLDTGSDLYANDRMLNLYNATSNNPIWRKLDSNQDNTIDQDELSRYNAINLTNYGHDSYDFAKYLGIQDKIGPNGEYRWLAKPIYEGWETSTYKLPTGWSRGTDGKSYYTDRPELAWDAISKSYGLNQDLFRSMFNSENPIFENGNLNINNLQTALGIKNPDGRYGLLTRQTLHNYLMQNKNKWTYKDGKYIYTPTNKNGGILKGLSGFDTSEIDAYYKKLDELKLALLRAAQAKADAARAAEQAKVDAARTELEKNINTVISEMKKPRRYYASGDRNLDYVDYFNKYLNELNGKLGSFNTEFNKLSNDQKDAIINNIHGLYYEKYKSLKKKGEPVINLLTRQGLHNLKKATHTLNGVTYNLNTGKAMINNLEYDVVPDEGGFHFERNGRKYKTTYYPHKYFGLFGDPETRVTEFKKGGILKALNAAGFSDIAKETAGPVAGVAATAGSAWGLKKLYDYRNPVGLKDAKLAINNFKTTKQLDTFLNNLQGNASTNLYNRAKKYAGKVKPKLAVKEAASSATRRGITRGATSRALGILDLPSLISDAYMTITGNAPKTEADYEERERLREANTKRIAGLDDPLHEVRYNQQGGSMTQEDLQEQLLTAATLGMIGYANANLKAMDFTTAVSQIMELALTKPETLQEIASNEELVKAGIEIMKQLEPEVLEMVSKPGGLRKILAQLKNKTKMAKQGSKLEYIQKLRGICPEGYEMSYMKAGGKVCPVCKKKSKKAQNGTKMLDNGMPVKKMGGAISDLMNEIKTSLFQKGGKTTQAKPQYKAKDGTVYEFPDSTTYQKYLPVLQKFDKEDKLDNFSEAERKLIADANQFTLHSTTQ